MHFEAETLNINLGVLPVDIESSGNHAETMHATSNTSKIEGAHPDPILSPLTRYWPEDLEGGIGALQFGGNNLPASGMARVPIYGERLPNWTNWGSLPFLPSEYLVLSDAGDHGGGAGTGGSNPCALGSQKIDWGFIAAKEGGSLLTAYIPPTGHSGATIASGFDLGQHSVQDLKVMGLDTGLIDKLSPLMGLQGAEAKNYLASHGALQISQAEANSIDAGAKSETLARLVTQYDTATHQPGAFYGLPARTQTAIADLAFQYGNLTIKAPTYWSEIVGRDWAGAISELKNFHDSYAPRRLSEADLIESDRVESRLLPQNIC